MLRFVAFDVVVVLLPIHLSCLSFEIIEIKYIFLKNASDNFAQVYSGVVVNYQKLQKKSQLYVFIEAVLKNVKYHQCSI